MRNYFPFLMATLLLALVGCANVDDALHGDGTIDLEDKKTTAPVEKYAVTVRVQSYQDLRGESDPRKIGIGGGNIYGLNHPQGDAILLKQEAAVVVTRALERQLAVAGYRVVNDDSARFVVSGAIQSLRYDVKSRDEIEIVLSTSIKDGENGQLVWSGLVEEKQDRYAGVSGNDISDVRKMLRRELGIVTQKTSDAITSRLMALHPELFGVLPGSKPVAGVTVLNAPVVPAVQPALVTDKGGVSVTSQPAGAKVYVDGVYYGPAPQHIELEPGVHEVSGKLSGYKSSGEKVAVRKGVSLDVELTLKK